MNRSRAAVRSSSATTSPTRSVFAIMPDLDGLAFSVGRRAKGVAGHFDAPSDVREFLAHLLDDERDASLP